VAPVDDDDCAADWSQVESSARGLTAAAPCEVLASVLERQQFKSHIRAGRNTDEGEEAAKERC